MDQRFPFLRPKEIEPKFLGGKKKASKQTNKNHQKTIYDVKTCFITCHKGCLVVSPFFPFPRLIVCFTFWQEGNAVGLPIVYSAIESNSAYRPFFTLPTIRQGSPHPGGLGEKGHHLWLLCGWCWGCFPGQSVQEPPCAIQRQITGFPLAHLGNPELLQSTTCQLGMRCQEVALAAGRGGSLGFVFLLSLSGIALSCY